MSTQNGGDIENVYFIHQLMISFFLWLIMICLLNEDSSQTLPLPVIFLKMLGKYKHTLSWKYFNRESNYFKSCKLCILF